MKPSPYSLPDLLVTARMDLGMQMNSNFYGRTTLRAV